MSRIKILLLILIIAALSIVFVQNRELTGLRFLCGYGSSYCLYRSPKLPLAVWIGLFTLIGTIISLLGQAINRYSYSNSRRPSYVPENELYPQDGWKNNDISSDSTYTRVEDATVRDNFSDVTSYEVKQEPQNVERSGSTYSYKYKEAGERQNSNRDNLRKTLIDSDANSTTAKEDDEEWI